MASLLASVEGVAGQNVDLVLNVSATPDPVNAGGTVTYTVRVANDELATTATGVAVVVEVPAGMLFVGFDGVGVACSGLLEGSPGPGTLDCTLPDISPEGIVESQVLLGTTTSGLFDVDFAVAGDQPDPEPANNSERRTTTVLAGSDLAVTLSGPATAAAGSIASYLVTISNLGPDPTSGPSTLSLPPTAGWEVQTPLPSGCSLSAGTINCTVPGPIPPEGVEFGPFSGQITVASPSTVSPVASVTSSQDPIADNNIATFETTVTEGSDVRLAKSRSAAGPYFVGDTLNLQLVSSFSGDAPFGLEVVDVVPGNYSILTDLFASTQGAWSCGAAEQTVTCTRPSDGLLPGANQPLGSITVPVEIVSAGVGVQNTATISSASPTDPNPANNVATDTPANLQNPSADLRVTKLGPNPPLTVVNIPFDYQIRAGNNGPAVFFGTLVVADEIPEGIQISGLTLNGWDCGSPPLPVVGPATLTCQRVYLEGSPLGLASAPDIVLQASATVAGPLTNVATVSSPNPNVGDDDLSNNTSSFQITSSVGPDAADLRVLKSALGPDPVPAGELLTYRIEVVNDGPQPATAVVLTDPFGSLINNEVGPNDGYVEETFVSGSATGITCSTSASGGAARTLTCTMDLLPVCTEGGDCPVFEVVVRPNVAATGTRTNTASVISNSNADPNLGNNSSSVSTQVEARADVTVEKNAAPDPVPAGQNLVYTVAAQNRGPSSAQGVTVLDSLPSGLLFVSAIPSVGTCSITPSVGSVTGPGSHVVQCSLGTITRDAQQTVQITARPTLPTFGATLTNVAVVSTSTVEPASGDANNRAAVDVDVGPPSLDLLVNKDDTVDPLTVDDETQYRIVVANAGPSDAENVVITDDFPPEGLSYESFLITRGSCVAPGVPVGGTLTCSIDRIEAGRADTLLVNMRGVAKGVHVNTVSVVSDETLALFDINPGNNSATEATTVRTRVNLEVVSKTAPVDPVPVRLPFTWSIVVRNNPGVGLAEADAVVVSDVLPPNMLLTGPPTVSADPGGSTTSTTCTGDEGASAFTCSLGTVDAGALVTISAPVRVLAVLPAPGVYENTASVTTSSQNVAPVANRSATGTALVQGSSLSARAVRDFDANASLDPEDTGLPGVPLTLMGTAFDGTAISRTGVTDAAGTFVFEDLPRGEYSVTRGTPTEPNLVPGGQELGNRGGDASVPGTISGIELGDLDTGEEYTFYFVPQARLGLAKRLLGSPEVQSDGSFLITFRIRAENFSLEELSGVSVADPLSGPTPGLGTFIAGGPAADLLPGTYTVQSLPAFAGVCPGGVVNSGFDGDGDALLASIPLLAPSGGSCEIDLAVRFEPVIPLPAGGYTNQAVGEGAGVLSGQSPTGFSQSGESPDPDGDGDPSNNSEPTPIPLVPLADLTVSLDFPAPVDAGDEVVGTVEFRNAGPSTAEGVGYTLDLGPGLSGVSFANLPTGATATYDPASGVVTFAGMPALIPAGGLVSGDGTTPIEVRYTQPGSGTSTVSAGISTTTDQGANALPDSGSTTVSGGLIADVTTSLDFPPSVDAGETVSGTVVFANLGPSTASDVTYTLELTPGLTDAAFGNLPPGASASYDPASGLVTLSGMPSTLAADAVSSGDGVSGISVSYTQPADATSRVATRISSSTTEPATNEADEAETLIGGELVADVTTSISFPPGGGAVDAGGLVEALVAFTNLGPSVASGVGFSIELVPGLDPAEVTFANLPPGASATYDPTTGVVTLAGMPSVLPAGAIASGDGVTGIEVRYTQVPTADSRVRSFIETTTNQGADLGPDTAEAPTDGSLIADVTTSLAFPASVDAGELVSGTVLYRNIGPSVASGVTFGLTLSPGLTDVAFDNLPPGATATYDPTTGIVSFTGMPMELPPGGVASGDGVAPISVTYTQPGGAVSTVTSVIGTTTDQGADAMPDTATGGTAGALVADVTTVLSFPLQVDPLEEVAGTILFRNVGPSVADGVSYELLLSPGLTGVTFGNLPAGATATYDPTTGVVTFSGMPTALPPGAVASGDGSGPISLVYTQPPSGPSRIESRIATTTGEGADLLPNEAVGEVASGAADVTTRIIAPASVDAGQRVDARVIFANNGPAEAEGVTYELRLEPGLQQVLFSNLPAGATALYDAATGIVTFTGMPTSLPPGVIASGDGVRGIGVQFNQPPTGRSQIVSRIGTTSGQGSDEAPDEVVVEIPGLPTADLELQKTLISGDPSPGDTLTYRLRVLNRGPSDAPAGAVLVDSPSQGLRLLSVLCSEAQGNVCFGELSVESLVGEGLTLPAIPEGGAFEVLTSGVVTASEGTVENAASLAPPPGASDPDLGNNVASVSIPLTAAPVIGVAKRLAELVSLPGDAFRVRFDIRVVNYGNEPLNDVRVSDPLGSAAGGSFGTLLPEGPLVPGSYRVIEVSAEGLVANPMFDGSGELVLAAGTLPLGGEATVSLTVEFGRDPSGSPILNQARVSATGAESGVAVEDLSQDGGDPDPGGGGRPSESDDTTSVLLPAIGVAKALVGIENRGDGRYDVSFSVRVMNLGQAPLTGVQVFDDLSDFGSFASSPEPGPGEYTVVVPPRVSQALNGAVLTPRADGSFTGAGGETALLVAESSLLPEGPPAASSGLIEFTVRFFPLRSGPFFNSAQAQGVGPAGAGVEDESVPGDDPDRTRRDPTPVPLEGQVIGLAKSVGEPTLVGPRAFQVSYRVRVENLSATTSATRVQITDDLRATFPTAQSIGLASDLVVESCTGEVLALASPPFDGTTQTSFLTGDGNLQPGDVCVFIFTVEVDYGTAPVPVEEKLNQAEGTTAGVAGGTIIGRDLSQNGDDPDPDGDGDPTNNEDPTPVRFRVDEGPGEGVFRVVKGTPLVNVSVGQLVPYEIIVTNLSTSSVAGTLVRDFLPPGFGYRAGTASVDGVPIEPGIVGRALDFGPISFQPGQTRVVRLILAVGAGVRAGEYTNFAQLFDRRFPPADERPLSERVSASVRVVPDALFECADILGSVFDDQNGNGVRDPGERGIPGVRLATARGWLITADADGRFHIACAAFPDPERGSNFLMKIDEESLAQGTAVAGANPTTVRLTAGKAAEVHVPVRTARHVRIEIRAEAFESGSRALRAAWQEQLQQMEAELGKDSVVVELILIDAGDPALSRARLSETRRFLESSWNAETMGKVIRIDEILEQPGGIGGGR